MTEGSLFSVIDSEIRCVDFLLKGSDSFARQWSLSARFLELCSPTQIEMPNLEGNTFVIRKTLD